MNEKVENLVLEQLRAIRAHTGRIDENVASMRGELTSLRMHVRGAEVQHDALHEDIAILKSRLDRIERRLDIVDDRPT
jgi:chromosome segregation ATPase